MAAEAAARSLNLCLAVCIAIPVWLIPGAFNVVRRDESRAFRCETFATKGARILREWLDSASQVKNDTLIGTLQDIASPLIADAGAPAGYFHAPKRTSLGPDRSKNDKLQDQRQSSHG
ncbi:MAG TPA: hypothetical protein PLH23_03950 [Hyphomonadaceae bacterium]|nr:hypothetical protein [Hyphomonadaceae bacterium]